MQTAIADRDSVLHRESIAGFAMPAFLGGVVGKAIGQLRASPAGRVPYPHAINGIDPLVCMHGTVGAGLDSLLIACLASCLEASARHG